MSYEKPKVTIDYQEYLDLLELKRQLPSNDLFILKTLLSGGIKETLKRTQFSGDLDCMLKYMGVGAKALGYQIGVKSDLRKDICEFIFEKIEKDGTSN